MLTGIYRDWEALPEGQRQGLREQNRSFRQVLQEPFSSTGGSAVLGALIGHATSFWTWHSLGHDNGLPNETSVTLMVRLVASVHGRGEAPTPRA